MEIDGMTVSRFTPSMMKHEDLESILVQRHQLAKQIVEQIRESAVTSSKHHRLIVGSRGMGKTYLVSLVYHRIRNLDDCKNHLLIAWLREEEWGVMSFLDLLLRIFRALKEEYGDQLFSKDLAERLESLYNLSPDAAERAGVALLKKVVGDKTLLLLMENLDELFTGLGKEGQKQFRSFLQKNACTTLATAQSLFNSVEVKTSPFYKFFDIHQLEPLTPAQATQLLANIARLEGKTDLELFIRSPRGRDRIKAVDYLAGGNPRIYVIFFEFLTRESLDELVEPFMRTLDNLTPYYQARMAWLSPQQRKIIEFLCDRRYPVTVKEIAQRCFVTHQTASSQLKDLKEKGYVNSEAIGRESFYELRELLMRFCLEVKKQRGEPIRLFVDLLRLLYTRTELQQQLGMEVAEIKYDGVYDKQVQRFSIAVADDFSNAQDYPKHRQSLEPLLFTAVPEREYLIYALQVIEEDGEDPRLAAYWREYENYILKKDFGQALVYAEKLVEKRGHAQDWLAQARCLCKLERYEEAMTSYDKAIDLPLNDIQVWLERGLVLNHLERYDEALASLDKAIELNPNQSQVWYLRGSLLNNLERYKEALASLDKAVELDSDQAVVWFRRGLVLDNLESYEKALVSYDKAIELDSDQAVVWFRRGLVLNDIKHYEEALKSLDKAIKLDPNQAIAWQWRGWTLDSLQRYEEALASYDKAIELDPNQAIAWQWRGDVLNNLECYEQALSSYEKAIEIDPNYDWAWVKRGDVLNNLQRYEQALSSYDKAIEIDPNYAINWAKRGDVLNNLQRYEEAVSSYDKVIEINPNYDWAWVKQGDVLNDLKHYEQALSFYDKAIEIDLNYVIAWAKRGDVLNNLQRYEEAVSSYDKVIEINPNYKLAWVMRGDVLNNLERYKEALASYDKAIEINHNYKLAWIMRGDMLNKLECYEEALASYDKAIEIDPDHDINWAKRGDMLNNLERYEEALASYDKVVEINPNYHWAWATRGDVLNNLERYEEALVSLDKAIELVPNYLLAWATRGSILNNLECYEQAVASLDKAIQIDPNYAWTWGNRGCVLINLRQYDEALVSCDRAIALGIQSSSVFFNRAIALLALNRWDEGITMLEDALKRLVDGDEPDAGGTELMLWNLFNSDRDPAIWKTRITTLLEIYDKHQVTSALGLGLLQSIPALMSEMVSDKAAETWIEVWREIASKKKEFQIPLRLINAGVRYKITKGDRRVLLELPIEERNLLQPLLETDRSGD
jgi:tetratricopeptide (TPR) repeat protein